MASQACTHIAVVAVLLVPATPTFAGDGHGGHRGHGHGGHGHWHGGHGHWHGGHGTGAVVMRIGVVDTGVGGWWGPSVGIGIGGYYGPRCWDPYYGYYRCAKLGLLVTLHRRTVGMVRVQYRYGYSYKLLLISTATPYDAGIAKVLTLDGQNHQAPCPPRGPQVRAME